MISNIINKEFYSISEQTNILWTQCETSYFKEFINTILSPCSLIDYDKTYYGISDISIVFCNNRLTHLEKCVDLAKFFHCPLVIVDHSLKSNLINENFKPSFDFEPVYQIAVSKDIDFSWRGIHNLTLGYDLNNNETINKWRTIIFQLIKKHFIIKETRISYENPQNKK